MKSLPSRGSDAPHVHQRLRKHLARCTLDCGFKTPESPALRGFVAERCPIRGTSLYLVLKSNGLHRPKIRLKKFSFSLKIVPAYISKKLPAQVLSQIVFHPVFQPLAQMAHVCLHSESGYTLGFRRRIAHSGLHAETEAFRTGPLSLPSERSARSQTSPGRVSERRTLPLLGLGRVCSRRSQKACGTAMRLCVSLFRGVAAPLGCVICLQRGDVAVFSLCAQCFLNVRGGGGITTLGAFHTVRKPCVAGYQNGKLCRFWVLAGCTPEGRRKPSEQRCAYARRCSEASRPRWAA